MPKRWLSSTAVTNLGQIRGKIAVTQQEKVIMIDAATGVAGKIDPGCRVNIYATFKAENDKQKDQSKVIVANARVIDVGKLTALDPDQSSADRRNSAGQAVPITFALGT